MKKLIIFDFDGVIADTMPDILRNSNLAAEKMGFSGTSTQEMVRNLKEMSFEELGRAMGITENMIEEFVKNILSFFSSKNSNPSIFSEMKEALKELAKNNFLSIITNNSRKAVNQFLLQNSLKDTFELIVDNDIPGSRTEKILSTQKHFDIAKENVYFVGDAVSDVEAAKEAAVHSIAVAWGNQDSQMLKDSSPEFIINTPSEILEIIK